MLLGGPRGNGVTESPGGATAGWRVGERPRGTSNSGPTRALFTVEGGGKTPAWNWTAGSWEQGSPDVTCRLPRPALPGFAPGRTPFTALHHPPRPGALGLLSPSPSIIRSNPYISVFLTSIHLTQSALDVTSERFG